MLRGPTEIVRNKPSSKKSAGVIYASFEQVVP